MAGTHFCVSLTGFEMLMEIFAWFFTLYSSDLFYFCVNDSFIILVHVIKHGTY
jgi:hypothetical protein